MVMIREATTLDLPFLEAMLYEAFFWNGGTERPALIEMRTRPEFKSLLADWGRNGDAALLADAAGSAAGAAWFRLWTPEEHSYGFVDHQTPELGIAVARPFRGQGIGRQLLHSLIEYARQHAYPRLSLSVAPDNPALSLYESEGFQKVGEVGTSWTMLRELRERATPIYPNCPAVIRVVTLGGLSKAELLHQLQNNHVSLNESADRLFASDGFTTAPTRHSLTTVELAVRDLGFPQGATTANMYARAVALGLSLCPLELGPHLRLSYLDQPEGYWGQPVRRHQAPSGSITVASEPLIRDDDFPRGFYVRRIKGELWLRGYRAGSEHVWEADDHLLFCRA